MPPFDPYLNWLGIPPHEQPPNFYRLLGVVLFEANPEVIERAADQQSLRVGAFQGGPQDEVCQQLLSEIGMAQFCLIDPQQKAAYDSQLHESLSFRGERSVAPPPPPRAAVAGEMPSKPPPPIGALPQFAPGPPQFGSPAPQFGPTPSSFPQQPFPQQPFPQQAFPQQAAGQFHPGGGMQMPQVMPGPMMPQGMPMQGAPMQGLPMPGPSNQSPIMQMPPAVMPAPAGFGPAMQHGPAQAAVPVAAPFPTPRAAAAPAPASGTAPAKRPPKAPARPIDELEKLTSQPATRRSIQKKRTKVDHTKEIIVAAVVATGAILLLIAFLAYKGQDSSEHGLSGIKADNSSESAEAKLAEERRQRLKEIADKREQEKKAAAAKASASGNSPLRTLGDSARIRPKNTAVMGQDVDSPARPFDSRLPDRRSVRPSQSDAVDPPDMIGTEDDLVMPPPGK